MARSDVPAYGLTLLNRWPDIMKEVQWRFNQISGDGVRQFPNCQNRVYVQGERDYIAQALMDSAIQAREHLGYPPSPMWVEDELVPIDSDYWWYKQTLSTRFGRVQAFGKRAVTPIAQNVAVTYTDADSDGVRETATLATVSGVSSIDASEIQVFFRVSDGADSGGSEYWRIEPVTVSKSGNNAVITGPRWLFVHPETIWAKEYKQTINVENGAWQKFDGDVANDDHFVTQVDVYRVYPDATNAAQLLLNPNLTTLTPVAVTADLANADQGWFTLRVGSGQSDPITQPMQAKVSYLAGLPLKNGRMDVQLETGIVRYANALMPQSPEMCERGAGMWRKDNETSDNLSQHDTRHPPAFGITSGGMHLASVVEARYDRLKGRTTKPE